jgi:hypothetical protein
MSAYGLQAITIDATVLTGIRAYSLDRRERMLDAAADGTLHQTMHAAKRAAPKVDFSTVAVESLMGLLTGSLDAPMRNIGSAADFIFALRAASAPGYGGTHRGIRLAKGHIYLNGLKWSPGGDGLEAACSAFGLSTDGTTDPVALITPTLPTVTPIEVFTLTSLTLGGLAITKCQSLDITIDAKADNGVEDVCFDLGLPFPKEMAVAGAAGPIEVSATVEGLDMAGSPSTSGSLVAVFTQYAFGGHLGANTITVTINAGQIREEGRTGGRPSSRRWKVMGRHDGTNRPLTITT